jgi:MFS family permease
VSGAGEVAAVARAVAPVASAGGRRLWRRWRPDLSPPALDAAQQVLAEKVLQQEQQRLAELGVIRRGEIAVPLDEGRSVREIVAIYDDVETGRLLLTGEPGSGKTVAVLELVLGLLERRQTTGQTHRAVPVRLNAAGWDGDLDATAFFAQRISEAYPAIRAPLAQALLTTRRVIVVLDGLDEVDSPGQPPRRAANALQRLSEDPIRDWPLVLTCRTDVYQQILQNDELAGRELLQATRITTEPLSANAINTFIRSHLGGEDRNAQRFGPAAEHLLSSLERNSGGQLARALQSPWLLSLTLDYLGRGGVPAARALLRTNDIEAIQDTLFAALIPIAVASQRRELGRRRYAEPDVRRWLTTLADYLIARTGSGTEVGLHELWPMAGRPRRTKLLAGLASGLAGGAMCGLVWGLWRGLAEGLVCGLIIGLVDGVAVGAIPASQPRHLVLRTHRKGLLWPRIKAGLTAGLLMGLALGIGSALPGRPAYGLGTGLIVALVFGPVASLLLGVPDWALPAQRARTVIRHDELALAAYGLVLGLCSALAYALGAAEEGGLNFAMTSAPVFGLIAGLGLMVATGQVTIPYLTAAVLFHHSGRFTGRPAPFLDWANHAGLLRTTGIRYQFRHETYRDWLVQQAQRQTTQDT